jgi:glycosyltransferase involved in cell wall biosynthesis
MNITIVAPVHIYSDVRVFQKEAKSLAANGYQVTLIARSDRRRLEDGVRILPAPAASNRLKRFLSLFAVLRLALAQRADIYHLHNPDTIPIAFALKLFRKRIIYDTHENFAQFILIKHWIPRVLRPPLALIVSWLEAAVSRVADRSIATEAGVVQRLGRNAVLIENPPVTQGRLIDEARASARDLTRGDEFRLVYVGTISRARGLDAMIDALELVNQKRLCRLWLIGGGADREIEEARQRPGWAWVDYLGVLPQANAFGYMLKADVGLVTFLNMGGHAYLNPNKLFEYMLFGIPFIASDFQAWRRLVDGVGAGVFADPATIGEIADKINWLAEHPDERCKMASRGSNFVLTNYNWETESKKLLMVYNSLTKVESI